MKKRHISRSANDEAQRIYYSLFHESIPEVIKLRFDEASRKEFTDVQADQQALYEVVLRNVLDLEALEIASRYTGRLPLLSKKMRLMVFLAETIPGNQLYFVNKKYSLIESLISIIGGLFKTAFKFLKGIYLMRTLNNA